MRYTAQDIANSIQGKLIGDPSRVVTHLSKIDAPTVDSLSFVAHQRYRAFLDAEVSRVVILQDISLLKQGQLTTFIIVEDAYGAFAKCSDLFTKVKTSEVTPIISDRSEVSNQAVIGNGVHIGAYSIISERADISNGVSIADQVFIGPGVTLGEGSVIMAGVKIMADVKIGARCIIYPNAVIGTDGFGHALGQGGHIKITHHGSVIIEDDVEIGANTVIDRAAIGHTIIRKGVKLDNLIQVAHGVEIGARTVIAAQTGISGSTKIGADCMIGGQVGIAGHLTIASGSKIQAKSGIASNITERDKKWYGYPVLGYIDYLRSFAIFKRLPELLRRLSSIEESIKDKS